MRRGILTLAIAALMSVGLVAGAAAHTAKFETTVTAKFNKAKKNGPDATPANFDGTVSSTKPACAQNRKVELKLRAPDGSSSVVGSALTDATGAWVVTPASVAPGTYFARVPKKVLRKNQKHRHVCKKAVSKDVTVK